MKSLLKCTVSVIFITPTKINAPQSFQNSFHESSRYGQWSDSYVTFDHFQYKHNTSPHDILNNNNLFLPLFILEFSSMSNSINNDSMQGILFSIGFIF